VLGIAERRRSLETLSLARIAVWGAVGAMTLPAVLTLGDVAGSAPGYGWRFPALALSVSAALGAACAATTVVIARRAATR
jgi:hypothetical protein